MFTKQLRTTILAYALTSTSIFVNLVLAAPLPGERDSDALGDKDAAKHQLYRRDGDDDLLQKPDPNAIMPIKYTIDETIRMGEVVSRRYDTDWELVNGLLPPTNGPQDMYVLQVSIRQQFSKVVNDLHEAKTLYQQQASFLATQPNYYSKKNTGRAQGPKIPSKSVNLLSFRTQFLSSFPVNALDLTTTDIPKRWTIEFYGDAIRDDALFWLFGIGISGAAHPFRVQPLIASFEKRHELLYTWLKAHPESAVANLMTDEKLGPDDPSNSLTKLRASVAKTYKSTRYLAYLLDVGINNLKTLDRLLATYQKASRLPTEIIDLTREQSAFEGPGAKRSQLVSKTIKQKPTLGIVSNNPSINLEPSTGFFGLPDQTRGPNRELYSLLRQTTNDGAGERISNFNTDYNILASQFANDLNPNYMRDRLQSYQGMNQYDSHQNYHGQQMGSNPPNYLTQYQLQEPVSYPNINPILYNPQSGLGQTFPGYSSFPAYGQPVYQQGQGSFPSLPLNYPQGLGMINGQLNFESNQPQQQRIEIEENQAPAYEDLPPGDELFEWQIPSPRPQNRFVLEPSNGVVPTSESGAQDQSAIHFPEVPELLGRYDLFAEDTGNGRFGFQIPETIFDASNNGNAIEIDSREDVNPQRGSGRNARGDLDGDVARGIRITTRSGSRNPQQVGANGLGTGGNPLYTFENLNSIPKDRSNF
ncbi:hypothetical protein ABW19_dt0207475 [Dactylella cylindrospora]|nr:hypothetical protein ABW19_dt0207475 [Dactylella cylindrospora]